MLRSFRRHIPTLLFFLSLATGNCALGSNPNSQIYLESVECWFDAADRRFDSLPEHLVEILKSQSNNSDPGIECYRMHVPENYAKSSSNTISFPVVRIKAEGKDGTKNPGIHLGAGGPGNPTGFRFANYSGLLEYYRKLIPDLDRDYYLIDPRGVGLADPLLTCTEYFPEFLDGLRNRVLAKGNISSMLKTEEECFNRLSSEKIDLYSYTSESVARDIENLRVSLGISKWNLYGVSYAARYALTLAREFPDSIESMVLDSPIFLDIQYIEDFPKNTVEAFDRLIEGCYRSSICNGAIDDPENTFWQTVENLNESPFLATIELKPNNERGIESIELLLDSTRFLEIMFTAMYLPDQINRLPSYIWEINNKELGYFKDLIGIWLNVKTRRFRGDAVVATNECYEYSTFTNYGKAFAYIETIKNKQLREYTKFSTKYFSRFCQIWKVPPAPDTENDAVVTDIPTLILQGVLDPITPAKYLAQQIKNFSSLEYFVFPDSSHGVLWNNDCGSELLGSFFDYQMEFRSHIDCEFNEQSQNL